MTASIWAPNGFSPEIVPFAFFEGVASTGQTVISIAPYTALRDSQLQVFVGGQLQNTAIWNISGTDVILSVPMTLGQSYRVDIYAASPVLDEELPSQGGNAGKFLTTDGTTPAWTDIPEELPDQSGQAGKYLQTNGTVVSWGNIPTPPPPVDLLEFYVTDNGMLFDNNPANAAINKIAFEATLAQAYAAGGGIVVMPQGTAYVNAIEFTWNAIISIIIRGQGQYATILRRADTAATPTIKFESPTSILDINSKIQDFSIWGNAKNGTGLELVNVANLGLERIASRYSTVGIENKGSLVLNLFQVICRDNNIGYRSRATTIYTNAINVFGGSFTFNSTWGMDIGGGSGFNVFGTQIEVNGTAGNVNTGGMIIRSDCDFETGLAIINLTGVWNERSFGWGLVVENNGSGGMHFSMFDCKFLAPEAGRAVKIGVIQSAILINCMAPSPGDLLQIAANKCILQGGIYSTITDTSTNQTYLQVQTSATFYGDRLKTNLSEVEGRTRLATTHKFLGGIFPVSDGAELATFHDLQEAGNMQRFYCTTGANANVNNAALRLGASSITNRSLNSGGTNNASGADYAEYHYKNDTCGVIEKGAIVGFDAQGKLTDKWDQSISFGVKSSDPSFVGGDRWHLNVPEVPDEDAYKAGIELERQKVDRIAYAGVVPVNVIATVGDYVIPTSGPDNTITAIATATPTFEQYKICVGRVRNIDATAKTIISVKVN